MAIACASISGVYVMRGQYRKALQYIQDAMRMKHGIDDRKTEATDYVNMAGIHVSLGEYSGAISAYENALRIARDIEDNTMEAFILDHLGVVYYYLGNFGYAGSLHHQADILIRQKKLEVEQFYNMLGRGRLHLAQKHMNEAKTCIDRACEIADKLGSRIMVTDSLLLLSEYHLVQGDKDLFSRSMKDLPDKDGQLTKSAAGHRDLLYGRFYLMNQDPGSAEHVLDSALRVFESLEEQYNIGRSYAYLAILNHMKGNNADFQAYLVTARGIFEAIGAKQWKERTDLLLTRGEPVPDLR
jgi:tetratricopeptide (TPR) repeat protein